MGKKKIEDLSWDLPAGAIEKGARAGVGGGERHPQESPPPPLPRAAACPPPPPQDVGAAAAAAAGAAPRRAGPEALRPHGKGAPPLGAGRRAGRSPGAHLSRLVRSPPVWPPRSCRAKGCSPLRAEEGAAGRGGELRRGLSGTAGRGQPPAPPPRRVFPGTSTARGSEVQVYRGSPQSFGPTLMAALMLLFFRGGITLQ